MTDLWRRPLPPRPQEGAAHRRGGTAPALSSEAPAGQGPLASVVTIFHSQERPPKRPRCVRASGALEAHRQGSNEEAQPSGNSPNPFERLPVRTLAARSPQPRRQGTLRVPLEAASSLEAPMGSSGGLGRCMATPALVARSDGPKGRLCQRR